MKSGAFTVYDFLISQPSHQSVNQYLPNRLKNRLNKKKIKMSKKTQCLGRFLDLNVKVYRSWKSDDWGLKSNEINTCETSWILHWLTNLSTKETQRMKGYSAQCNSSTPECGGKIFLPQLPFKLLSRSFRIMASSTRFEMTDRRKVMPTSFLL